MKTGLFIMVALCFCSIEAHAGCGIGVALDNYNSSPKQYEDMKRVLSVILKNEGDGGRNHDTYYYYCEKDELNRADKFFDTQEDYLIGTLLKDPNDPALKALRDSQKKMENTIRNMGDDDK
jgi:hypothetical protein